MTAPEPAFEEDTGVYRVRAYYLAPLGRFRVDVNLSEMAGVNTRTIPAMQGYGAASALNAADREAIQETARLIFQEITVGRVWKR